MERATLILSRQKKRLKQPTVECTPPSSFDADWAKDGLKEKTPSGVGTKAFWMQQIISMIPLRDWSLLLDDPDPFALKLDPDWADAIIDGWCKSAQLHPDADSLLPLLQRLASEIGVKATASPGNLNQPAVAGSQARFGVLSELLQSIPPEDLADALERLAMQEPLLLELVRRHRPAVDSSKHKALYKILVDWVFSNDEMSKPEAIALSACFDPAAIPSLLIRVSKLDELSSAMEEFARALEQRQNYLKHFSEESMI